MEKINKMLKEKPLVRRIMLGIMFAAMCICFVLCITFLIWSARSVWWLFGVFICGLLAGAFGGMLFHLALMEEED